MQEDVPDFVTPVTPASTYTSRPVSITAIQWTGSTDSALAIAAWASDTGAIVDTDHIQHLWDHDGGGYVLPSGKRIFAPYGERCLIVMTLEGEMVARRSDWIIKGTEGEFYPCKDSVFQRKYQKLDTHNG